MRTHAVVVTTLLVLASISTGVAVGHAPDARAHAPDAPNVGAAPGPVTVQNDTEVQFRNLSVGQLNLTNVSADFARINDTVLEREAANATENATNPLGTATATNLTVVNATLYNVTMHNVTIRNQTVVDQLFDGEVPEEENVTLENATLDNVTLEALVVEESRIGTVGVQDIRASISPVPPTPEEAVESPTLEIENLTVGSASLADVEAGSANVENATIGIGSVLGGGDGTTTADGNESAMRRAPER